MSLTCEENDLIKNFQKFAIQYYLMKKTGDTSMVHICIISSVRSQFGNALSDSAKPYSGETVNLFSFIVLDDMIRFICGGQLSSQSMTKRDQAFLGPWYGCTVRVRWVASLVFNDWYVLCPPVSDNKCYSSAVYSCSHEVVHTALILELKKNLPHHLDLLNLSGKLIFLEMRHRGLFLAMLAVMLVSGNSQTVITDPPTSTTTSNGTPTTIAMQTTLGKYPNKYFMLEGHSLVSLMSPTLFMEIM